MSNIRIPFVAAMALSLCAVVLPVRADDNQQGNQNGDNESSGVYLALGDSVPFGYNPTIDVKLNKYVGFPKIVGQITDLKLTNAACPYETTGSLLIGGCPWLSQPGPNPLFIGYGDGSQMDFAVKYLRTHKVNLVTIMIGGNDLAPVVPALLACGHDIACAQNVLGPVLTTVGGNLATAFIRLRASGYQGPIVAVNYYGLDYTSPTTAVFQALNKVIHDVGTHMGVKVADAFSAFYAVSGGNPCAAGLLIKKADGIVPGGCDIHPSVYGQTVLAGTVMATLGITPHDN